MIALTAVAGAVTAYNAQKYKVLTVYSYYTVGMTNSIKIKDALGGNSTKVVKICAFHKHHHVNPNRI